MNTARMLLASAAVGVAAGVAGTALTLLLHLVQHIAFGYTESSFLVGVEHADDRRRVLALAIGGLVAGVGWWLYRRFVHSNISVTHALAEPDPQLPLAATAGDAGLQILAVGIGASLGREGAPRQVGAALAGAIARRIDLDAADRRVLFAAGAGAGLAAVYTVPIGGAVFALELLVSRRRLRAVVPMLVACGVATVVAWPLLGHGPTYRLPHVTFQGSLLGACLVVGPIAALAGLAFRAAMTAARRGAPSGWRAAVAIPVTFACLGAVSIAYPALLGNGKGAAELAFTGSLSTGLAAVLTVLKPVATAACLRSGAIGGLLTPAFATGAALGALLSRLAHGGVQTQTGYALLGAAALLSVAQRAAWTSITLTVEFTHSPLIFLVPVAGAVLAAKATEHLLHWAVDGFPGAVPAAAEFYRRRA